MKIKLTRDQWKIVLREVLLFTTVSLIVYFLSEKAHSLLDIALIWRVLFLGSNVKDLKKESLRLKSRLSQLELDNQANKCDIDFFLQVSGLEKKSEKKPLEKISFPPK